MDNPARASLWKEGFRLFDRYKAEWIRWALGFFVAAAILDFLIARLIQTPDIEMAIRQHQGLPPGTLPTMFVLYAGFLILTFAQSYLFNAFFLIREPVAGTAVLGIRGFLSYLGAYLRVILVVAGLMLGLVVVFALGAGFTALLTKLAPSFDVKSVSGIVGTVLAIIDVVIMIYVMIRLSPVFVLAANRVEHPVRNGWRLMQGQWWRVFGNLLIVVFLVMLAAVMVSIIAGLLLFIIGAVIRMPIPALLPALKPVLQGAMQVATSGVVIAFNCALCRILYQEKRQSDSSFVLTTRS